MFVRDAIAIVALAGSRLKNQQFSERPLCHTSTPARSTELELSEVCAKRYAPSSIHSSYGSQMILTITSMAIDWSDGVN
jgi:hypothetical protein